MDSWEAGIQPVNDVCVVCVSAVSQSSGRHLPSSVENVAYFRSCLPVTSFVQPQVEIHSSEALSIRQPHILTQTGLQRDSIIDEYLICKGFYLGLGTDSVLSVQF